MSIFDAQVGRLGAAYAHASRAELEGEIDSWLNEDSHVDEGWAAIRTLHTDSRQWGTGLVPTDAYGAVSLRPCSGRAHADTWSQALIRDGSAYSSDSPSVSVSRRSAWTWPR